MKRALNFTILYFFICCTVYAQERIASGITTSSGFNSEDELYNVVNNFNQLSLNDNISINQQNAVFIQQIGDYNSVFSQSQSQSSQLNLIQNGDFNNISIDVIAPSIKANVIQNGHNNSVYDNIYYSNLEVKLNAIQNGKGLTINRIGVNSLSNNMQIIQEGSYKSITIISN